MSGRIPMSTNRAIDFAICFNRDPAKQWIPPTKKPQSFDMTAVSGVCGSLPRVSRQSNRGSTAGTFFQFAGGNNNGMSPADA